MRDGAKAVGILLTGLFIAGIGYPFLHEAGHTAAALIAGAEVLDFQLFPLPSILCNIGAVRTAGRVMIGTGGILLPFLVSVLSALVWKENNFWVWYANIVLKGINLLATGMGLASMLGYRIGLPVDIREDFMRIVEIWPSGLPVLSAGLFLMLVLLAVGLWREHPVKKCLDFFA